MDKVKNIAHKLNPTHHSNDSTTTRLPPQEQTILITGASGFVAAHVLTAFLKAGYNVRGTVRSASSADAVLRTHVEYTSQLTFAIVPDISAPGAFDDAVKDVHGIIHTASPFQMSVEDNERDLLRPAIAGTKNLVQAAAAHAPLVQRIVITSSFAAIIDMGRADGGAGYVYTEKDWNPCSYADAIAGPGPVAYCASKAFAEKAAWDFVADEKNKAKFDIATICPPMIYGPVDHAVTDLNKLNTSSADIWRFMNGSATEIGDTGFPLFADVRDVALAHLRAYEIPEAGGQRFAITSGNFTYEDVCTILREEYPNLRSKVPDPSASSKKEGLPGLSNEKAKKVLGLQFRNLKETIKDTADSLIKLEKEAGR